MLCELLERQYFSGMGKYWAKEVSIDPWAAKGKPKRVDLKDGRVQLITYGRSEDAEKAFKEMTAK